MHIPPESRCAETILANRKICFMPTAFYVNFVTYVGSKDILLLISFSNHHFFQMLTEYLLHLSIKLQIFENS